MLSFIMFFSFSVFLCSIFHPRISLHSLIKLPFLFSFSDKNHRPVLSNLTSDKDNDGDDVVDGKNSTTNTGLVEQGRYIKGDPLNGYYDFVITEGSYKFWVVFQVTDEAVMIIGK